MKQHFQLVPQLVFLPGILISACRTTVGPAPMEPINLAANPGFEQLDDGGSALSWTLPGPVYRLDTTAPHGGQHCLRFDNPDAEHYVLTSAPIELQAGRQYEFEVWVRTDGIAGSDSGATICLQWWGQDNRFLGGSYPPGVKGTSNGWQQVCGRTPPIPAEAVRCDVTCYVRKGMTGTAWWDDVRVRRYVPPAVDGIVTNAYRNWTAGRPVTVKLGVCTAALEQPLKRLNVRLRVIDAAGRDVAVCRPAEYAGDHVSFRLETADLPPETYTLSGEIRRRGRLLGSASCPLKRRRELPPVKARIDEHQRLIVDGQPFFPLGTYWGSLSERDLDIYAKSPFNCVMPYGKPNREMLDAAESRGIKVIYSVKDLYHGTRWAPPGIDSEADERRALAEAVARVGDHPAVIAWYINDELPLSMLDQLTAHRDWMEELDPGRPTWVVLYQYAQVRSYLPSFDVIGTDPYPIPAKPVSTALAYTRRTVAGTMNARAVWMVPQIFNWASYKDTAAEKRQCRAPTLEEMRSMAWQCIAGGANGLIFYSWFDLWRMDRTTADGGRALEREPFAERWPEVVTMADEIRRLMPVLLSVDEPPSPVSVEAPAALAWRLYQYSSDTYLVTANGAAAAAAARFRFPRRTDRVEILLGNAPPTGDGSELQLHYDPLEVKIVRLIGQGKGR